MYGWIVGWCASYWNAVLFMINTTDESDSGGNSRFFQSTSVTPSYSSNVVCAVKQVSHSNGIDSQDPYFFHCCERNLFFLKHFWSPFCGATDTPVLDWWRLLWVSKPEWEALFAIGRGVRVTHSLRFTSGVTPTDQPLGTCYTFPNPILVILTAMTSHTNILLKTFNRPIKRFPYWE